MSATLRLRTCLLAGVVTAFAFGQVADAQVRGSAGGLHDGTPDKQTMAYVASCLGGAPPRPTELYARGGWFRTDDLREQMREHNGNLEGVAIVWRHTAPRGPAYPGAVYQWNHDLEFNRDVIACLDAQGRVTRSQSRYTPAGSERKQRWTYIHTVAANPHDHGNHQGTPHGSGRFTDAQGHPMGRPHLTTEDQDFIAGERVFHQWKDFDFASLVDAPQR